MMKRIEIIFFAALAFLGPLPAASQAQDDVANPAKVIEQSTDRILRILEEHTEGGDIDSVSAFADELLSTLEPVVDFDSIARGVMGRHTTKATEAQVEKFEEVFRETLVSLYARSFKTFEVKEIHILDMPADFDPEAANKATVRMRATTADDTTVTLSYSMRRDENREWVVRNIILDGINLGLTYMNQFDGAMSRHGSVDKVIGQWPEEMDDRTIVDGE